MKSNMIKMVTMCMCMMVVGFASEDKQSIHVEKELISIPAQQQIIDEKSDAYSVQKRMDAIQISQKVDAYNKIKSNKMQRIQRMTKEMIESQNATLSCDLFIAIGSSLQVYPAAGFPILAKRNGAKLIILNREPTDLDGYADLILNYEIGTFMNEVFSLNN